MRSTKFLLALVVLTAAAVLLMGGRTHALSAADWTAGRIIDDVIFYNKNAMSVPEIQAFLNAKVPVCDKNRASSNPSYQPPWTCLKDYIENPSTGESNYGRYNPDGTPSSVSGGKSAAQIIWDSAQAYNINPQVLIVLLQKEQSLVTDDWPWLIQYQHATGYSCPDTAPCNPAYAGFYRQVDGAAWQFRHYAEVPEDFNYDIGWNNILWSPNPCGSSGVYIENRATASLYNYTPYQPNAAALNNMYGSGDGCSAYGNRNFWRMFNDWFGPTKSSILIRKGNEPAIYLLSAGKKYRIPNLDVLMAYGYGGAGVITVSDFYFDSVATGGDLSNLIRGEDGTVYLVTNTKRYKILSLQQCTDWGLECQNPYVVNTLSSVAFSTIGDGGELLPLMSYQGGIFKMVAGKRQPFQSQKAMFENGYGYQHVRAADALTAANKPLDILLPHQYATMKFPGSNALYIYIGASFYTVGSYSTFVNWQLDKYQVTPAPSSYDSVLPASAGTLTDFATINGKKYLIDQGKLIDLDPISSHWPSAPAANFAAGPAGALKPVFASSASTFRGSDGAIYLPSSSNRRAYWSPEDFFRLGYDPAKTISITDAHLDLLNNSAKLLASGRSFKKPGDDAIYMTNSNASSLKFPTLELFWSYRFSPSGLANVDATTGSAYPSSASLGSLATRSYGLKSVVGYLNGTQYVETGGQLAQWGISAGSFQVVADPVLNAIAGKSMSRFARRTDGAIFYADNGQKHLISSYQKFIELGGSPDNTMQVFDDFLNAAPTGSSL